MNKKNIQSISTPSTKVFSKNNFDSIYLLQNEHLSQEEFGSMIAHSVYSILAHLPHSAEEKNTIEKFFWIEWHTIYLWKTKKILQIWDKYFSDPHTQWYVDFSTTSDGYLYQQIRVRQKLSKHTFSNTLFHEIHHFIYNILKFNLYRWKLNINNAFFLLQNEFLTRVHTANHSMLQHNNWQDRDTTWQETWSRNWWDWYSQATQLATYYITSRNHIYNALLQQYGVDPEQQVNVNIRQPWYTVFSQIAKACDNYLYYIDNLEWLVDFLNIVKRASQYTNSRDIIAYFQRTTYNSTYPEAVDLFLEELPKV